MIKHTLTSARALMLRGSPWTFCLTESSGLSWTFSGRAQNEVVGVKKGVPGTIPTSWAEVEKVVPELVAQGYDYVPVGFVRVRVTVIQQFALNGPTKLCAPSGP